MSKFNISFDVDMDHITPELVEGGRMPTTEAVEEAFSNLLLKEARQMAKQELHAIRRDPVMDSDVKTIKMAEQLRKMMFGIMAEANLKVTKIPESVLIQTELPFEQQYAA